MNTVGKLNRLVSGILLVFGIIGSIYWGVTIHLGFFFLGAIITLCSAAVPLGIAEILDLLEGQKVETQRLSHRLEKLEGPDASLPTEGPSYFQKSSAGAAQQGSTARRCANCGLSLATGITVCPKCKHENP